MKNQLIILFVTFIVSSCTSQKKCIDFKIGAFKYSDKNYSEWSVVRTDSTQTEISSKSGIEIYSSVEWKSDCNYVLTFTKILNSELQNLIGKKVEVTIIDAKSDRYTCKSTSDELDLEIELVKIN